MSFQNLGGFGWTTDGDDEPNEENELLERQDLFASKTLELVQKCVRNYVNLRDDSALIAFQSCLGEIMRQASECMQENSDMEIKDN